ncbi:d80d03a5-df61-43f8-a9e8-b0a8f4e82a95-CDS [Sclerotinia trifoliorum]|uniref:D80d03a5-df61-43f8-a9e8-b0a8f4e82a95-CDS n=1 Tax=Sclerotinia trifoliorum TaxID=28548 RepID=A0A8H2VLK8_9HELO|nr:d80d03a5-df61-43f8-a9e8-b0a8f4e82a95-CDS [Sclerotinia trifoliorum]
MAANRARSDLTAREQSVNSFVNPLPQKGTFTQDYSNNLVLKDGSTINLTWTSNYIVTFLTISQVLNCAGGELGCNSNFTLLRESSLQLTIQSTNLTYTIESIPKSPNIALWTVDSSPYNLSESNIFYFTIHNGSTRNFIASFTSRYFNISTSNDIPRMTDAARSLSTKRHEIADPVPTIDLPVGAEIGIGLGIGVVSCVVVLAVALLFRCIRRSRYRRHASKNSPTNIVDAGDNLRVSRGSWVQALGMRQNTSDEESISQYRWTSPDDVTPRYEPPDSRREMGILDEVRLENPEESIHNQNNQNSNPSSNIHLAPVGGAASHFIDDCCGSWTSSPSYIFQVPGDASCNFQHHQNFPVPAANLESIPSQYIHQLERYMLRKNSIEIQHPLPTYAPWLHHELINRSNSIGSIQQTPTQFQSRYEAKEKQEFKPNANKLRVLKEGYTTSHSTNHELSVSTHTQVPRIKQILEITPKRKSKENAPQQTSQLMSPSVLETLKREKPTSLRAELEPGATHEATYEKQYQNPEQEKYQLPHPLKSHPQAQLLPPPQTKSSIQNPTLILPLVGQCHSEPSM